MDFNGSTDPVASMAHEAVGTKDLGATMEAFASLARMFRNRVDFVMRLVTEEKVSLDDHSFTCTLNSLDTQVITFGLHLAGFFDHEIGNIGRSILQKLNDAGDEAAKLKTDAELEDAEKAVRNLSARMYEEWARKISGRREEE